MDHLPRNHPWEPTIKSRAGGLEGRLSQRLAESDVNVGVLQTG